MTETVPASGQIVQEELKCYHCGQLCAEDVMWLHEKSFCCYGCQTVYEILNENNLCEYYDLDRNPGIQLKKINEDAFAYLDDVIIRKKILEFDSPSFSRVRFYIPAIHCVSCIWLLENLQKLNKGTLRSEVNFARKSVVIDFNSEKVGVSEIARLLASLGYAPQINLDSEKKSKSSVSDQKIILKLAIAGFCFGNVMLFSFPEYLGLNGTDPGLQRVFSWLNVLLSVPVFFYSGFDYVQSAWKSFKQRQINIDVPIAAGLVALLLRSIWDITLGDGPGYLDSFTGLVFFLLIGRWFQSKTYESLAFDRDFKSYFPLAVQKLFISEWRPVVVYNLVPGDQILIRNMEIIPADSILLHDEAFIDYSFVTGESKPTRVTKGELVYAGGRLIGQPVQLQIDRKTSQSHLTSLWNNDIFQKTGETGHKNLIDKTARVFTWVILGLALLTGVYWYIADVTRVWLIITAVLMVACPCALALAAPFTYGSMLRAFGRHGFYLKNADVIERMASLDAVVFDKTGTITHGSSSDVKFDGSLSGTELGWIKQITSASTHPLSNLVSRSISQVSHDTMVNFKEFPGRGIQAEIDGSMIKIGSAAFTGFQKFISDANSKVFVSINDEARGYFSVGSSIRKPIAEMVKSLGKKCVALLSGDNDYDREKMKELFPAETQLNFNQSPHDKLNFIRNLQEKGKQVMMIGDGLNDSGALKQSNVGIAVTDDTGIFTPACDGILRGDKIGILDKFLKLSKTATMIVKTGFGISFFYNVIALSFAVSGHLTPLVAAILMPVSSISVVGFTTLAVGIAASRRKI